MNTARANTLCARALVEGLALEGVRHAVVTPGSRSTPLVFAFADQSAVRPWLVLDERSAGFFALGLARALGEPVAIACTSGTAVANLAPAIVEANLSRVPVIALTADRPPRLRDVGAAQTIDQVHFFGRQVRWSVDLPVPSGSATGAFTAAGRRAARASLEALPGPVQVNVPFDEPLIEPPAEHPGPWEPRTGACSRPRHEPDPAALERVAALAAGARRPIIVAGPESGGLPVSPLLALAYALDAPLLADPLSGLRAGVDRDAPVLDAFDAWLRGARVGDPDFVLRFGAAPTSKTLNQLLAALPAALHVVVDLPGGYREPNGLAPEVLVGDPAAVAEALACAGLPRAEPGWRAAWVAADRAARNALDTAAATDDLFEGRIFALLREVLPAGATLVAGNSMPVRDLENFFGMRSAPATITANRGANGIDGVMSSAAGAAASGSPTVVVVGDVSFHHDTNALWAVREHHLPLLAIVVNNNGGGIFHYLPQVAHDRSFERWFATPPNLDFRHAARLFDLEYTCAGDWPTFERALGRWCDNPAPAVLELRTDRRLNVALHQRAWDAAVAAASEVLAR